MESAERIIGIDPGTRHVGYGVVERQANRLAFLAGGCISATGPDIAVRLVTIHRGLSEVIREFAPACAAIETVFTGNNPKTAIAIGEGRGVAVLSVAEQGLRVTGYAPAMVKRAVAGNGRADKDQVRAMVQVILGLGAMPETDHEADALALAITHARHYNDAALGVAAPKRGRTRGRAIPDFFLNQIIRD
ncbi:MAG: crossover junction endodeoxyribonuclease RuvC [Planctomycetaceae bacterium]|nr:crossover junction endodeoxyribonuclease RuvC [Planctomycetaceae bacterium]